MAEVPGLDRKINAWLYRHDRPSLQFPLQRPCAPHFRVTTHSTRSSRCESTAQIYVVFFFPSYRKFTCHLCDRSFTEKWALNNHMKLHTGEKPFKCTWPTCHYSFLTASAMKDHYRTHTGVSHPLTPRLGHGSPMGFRNMHVGFLGRNQYLT